MAFLAIFIISSFLLAALIKILVEKEYFLEEEEEDFFPEEDEDFFIEEEEEEFFIQDLFLGFFFPEELFHSIMSKIDFYLSTLLSFFVEIWWRF